MLVAVLSAYLIQAIILPDFKIAGVMLDVITITLYACGFSLGMYAGIAAGLLGAMILETVGGDLAGLTSVLCVTAGVWGAWVHRRLSAFSLVGNRRRERLIKRFTPMLAVGAFIVCKELLYLAYFYLTGVDIVFIHVFRVVFAGVLGAAASLALLPLWRFFLLRRAEDTLLARPHPQAQGKERGRTNLAGNTRQPGKEVCPGVQGRPAGRVYGRAGDGGGAGRAGACPGGRSAGRGAGGCRAVGRA